MDVEPAAEDDERHRAGIEREAFLQLAFPGRRRSVQSEQELDYGITSEDEKCERSEDEMSVPSRDMQVVSRDIEEGQDDSDGDTAGAVVLRFLDAKSAAKQRLEQEVRKNLKRIDARRRDRKRRREATECTRRLDEYFALPYAEKERLFAEAYHGQTFRHEELGPLTKRR